MHLYRKDCRIQKLVEEVDYQWHRTNQWVIQDLVSNQDLERSYR